MFTNKSKCIVIYALTNVGLITLFNQIHKHLMKNKLMICAIAIACSTAIFGCKGGVSGEKSDSTMLDTQARDSAAAKASAAHQLRDSTDRDTMKKDSAAKKL